MIAGLFVYQHIEAAAIRFKQRISCKSDSANSTETGFGMGPIGRTWMRPSWIGMPAAVELCRLLQLLRVEIDVGVILHYCGAVRPSFVCWQRANAPGPSSTCTKLVTARNKEIKSTPSLLNTQPTKVCPGGTQVDHRQYRSGFSHLDAQDQHDAADNFCANGAVGNDGWQPK